MAETPQLDQELVEEFVGKAHGDSERTKELLGAQPTLVNASWDWGNGNWETALGAASHMGRKDIALHLLENGARMDVFAAAMLGKVDIVKSMLDDDPRLSEAKGPHGIPLLAHADAGGDDAKAVADLLAD